ncbi:MAG: hypothetical protein GYA24_06755 [Candidatus Lokiarchaeota archaeon]|nr:hypothetical protein [Candidatus Lokiarchaeota archaeon]
MSENNPLLQAASNLEKQAIESEKKGNLSGAIQSYKQAADMLLVLIKTSKNTSSVRMASREANRYIERVKVLQAEMDREKQELRSRSPEDRPHEKVITTEKEVIIKEIVKIKCRHCGYLVENTMSECPICGANM